MVCGSLYFESKFSYDDPKRSSWAAFYEESLRSLAISDKKLNRVFVLYKLRAKRIQTKLILQFSRQLWNTQTDGNNKLICRRNFFWAEDPQNVTLYAYDIHVTHKLSQQYYYPTHQGSMVKSPQKIVLYLKWKTNTKEQADMVNYHLHQTRIH